MKINESCSKKTQTFISAGAVLIATLTIAVTYHTPLSAAQTRQEEIAVRGAKVMPFDLEQTTHVFQELDDGGLQKVIVKDPSKKNRLY